MQAYKEESTDKLIIVMKIGYQSKRVLQTERTVKASGVTGTGARNIPLKTNGAGTGTEFGCKGSGSR